MTKLQEDKPKGKYNAEYRELWLLQVLADPLLTPRFFKVAYILAMHTNTYTGQSYPTRETVVRQANVCERTVDRAMNFLEKRGHLRRVTTFNGAKRTRHMRCWPLLRRTELSVERDKTVHNLWTKLAEDSLTRDSLTSDTHILTASAKAEVAHGDSTGNGQEVDSRDKNGFFSTSISPLSTEPVDSLVAECYRLARLIPDGEQSAAIMAKALKTDGWDVAEASGIAREVHASGGDARDLAAALWIPDSNHWSRRRWT